MAQKSARRAEGFHVGKKGVRLGIVDPLKRDKKGQKRVRSLRWRLTD